MNQQLIIVELTEYDFVAKKELLTTTVTRTIKTNVGDMQSMYECVIKFLNTSVLANVSGVKVKIVSQIGDTFEVILKDRKFYTTGIWTRVPNNQDIKSFNIVELSNNKIVIVDSKKRNDEGFVEPGSIFNR